MIAALRAGAVPASCEVETASGRVLEIRAGTPTDVSGACAGHYLVLRDRTGERRAERLLHQSQRLESVGILAAGVAHEVNNPLSFVRSNLAHLHYLSSLLEDGLDRYPKDVGDELRDMGQVIEESVSGLDRVHRIVEGLLRFSSMPSGRKASCDVNESLLEAARFASLDPSAPVGLETRLGAELPRVHASPDQLVQIFLNLLLNAKHALEGKKAGRIVASSTRTGEGVEVRIHDNGPGVPDEIRGKVFDPFFTTRARNEGAGLGLSISFDIVRDHGGSLELEVPPGGGACFVVRLPACSDD